MSLVSPSFQQGKFLARTIDSVLSQDYPHIDYCVVDGGSTDETIDVLNSYGGRFPWISEKDRGQTHALNKGFAQASGQIRAYLNSDDLLRPGAVREAVEHFRRHPDCDLVYGRGAHIDTGDQLIRFYPTKPYTFENLMETCCISQPSAFWTSRIAGLVGPFDESYAFAMDYDYWLRIAKSGGRIMHADGVWSATRMHPAAKTCGGSRDRIFAEIWRTCTTHGGYVSCTVIDSWLQTVFFSRYPMLPAAAAVARPPLVRALEQPSGPTSRSRRCRSTCLSARWYCTIRPAMPGSRRGNESCLPYRCCREVQAYVRGHRRDNWLASECRFYPKRRGPAEPIRLIGEAPVPMRLIVRQGKETVAEYELPGQEVNTLTLPVRESPEPVLLAFSEEFVAGLIDRQPVSFRVLATNLYREDEGGLITPGDSKTRPGAWGPPLPSANPHLDLHRRRTRPTFCFVLDFWGEEEDLGAARQ